jgi:hypothetical protein
MRLNIIEGSSFLILVKNLHRRFLGFSSSRLLYTIVPIAPVTLEVRVCPTELKGGGSHEGTIKCKKD